MEDYRRNEKKEPEQVSPPAKNEIRCSQSGKITRYVDVGLNMFKEQNMSDIVIVGKGATINKAVTVVEIIKRKMEGSLHQYTQLGSVSSTDQWDPKEGKSMDRMVVTQHTPVILIHLSKLAIPDLEATSG
ncbi:DNA/RNA-binding protein alba-like protein [Phascolomyces articulosus]|uniref:DNA/RNA-binding protein alba-like protein n=1 Tax=Phascolomyces articulosus TaxID=60185 RepID=A0AAD5JP14_9FUNG|nr:DNA/RNA-binding protein alba-like protein [Phascolomyces articulosus]